MNEHIKAEPEQILFTVFELERAIKTERDRIIELLDENQKCRLDGGCNTKGYCFCIARQLVKGEVNATISAPSTLLKTQGENK